MFADALLDSHHQSRRGWATLTSFGVQAIAVVFLLVVPLFYTQVLPRLRVIPPVIIAPLGERVVQQPMAKTTSGWGATIYTIVRTDALMQPSRIPHGFASNTPVEVSNIPIGSGIGSHIGVPDGILGVAETATNRPLPPPPAVAKPIIVSRMMEGSLAHRVEPIYPPLAIAARIQGIVVLEAVIGRDGAVKNLQSLSGHPLLVPAAINAVNQWRYHPYILNGVPVEVDTHVTVNFILSR